MVDGVTVSPQQLADTIRERLEKGDRDDQLLDGRAYDGGDWLEAYDALDVLVRRLQQAEEAFRSADFIAGRIDLLLAGVEDQETLEECRAAAGVWMRDLAAIRDRLAKVAGVPAAGDTHGR